MRAMTHTHHRRGTGRIAAVLAGLAVTATVLASSPAYAIDAGYWYGADSAGPAPSNGSAPYNEPNCGSGHAYGGYIGKIGGADLVSGSNTTGYGPGSSGGVWNATDAADADTNHFSHSDGVGAGGYWFMLGPTAPGGQGMSAYAWGQQQGSWAVADWQRWYNNGQHKLPLRILWADVESSTAVPNGWGSSGATNRQVFNGFFDKVTALNQGMVPGVYSTAVQWNAVMAGNTSIANTWEWTAQTSSATVPSPCPSNFANAVFFGGQTRTSAHAAVYQFALAASGDYDMFDANRNLPD